MIPDEKALGRELRDEVSLERLRADRIDHMLFTIFGNGPSPASLKEGLGAAGTSRDHYVVNIAESRPRADRRLDGSFRKVSEACASTGARHTNASEGK